MIPGNLNPNSFLGEASGVSSRTYIGGVRGTANPSNAQTVTLAGANIATAAANRYIVMFLVFTSQNFQGTAVAPTTVTSFSVGGVAMTKLADTNVTAVGGINQQLWISSAPVPTGTTGTISVVFANNTLTTLCIALGYSVYNLSSTTPFSMSLVPYTSNTTNYVATVNLPANGIVMAMNATNAIYTNVAVWSGVNADFNGFWQTDRDVTAASLEGTIAGTAVSISVTSPTASRGVLGVVSFI